jgi:hypothetical protein
MLEDGKKQVLISVTFAQELQRGALPDDCPLQGSKTKTFNFQRFTPDRLLR